MLADTVRADELLGARRVSLIARLFRRRMCGCTILVRSANHCPYDPAKIHSMLRGVGQTESEAIIAEQGGNRVTR